MPQVSTFAQFFGFSGSSSSGYVADGAIEYAGHLQLEQFGQDIVYVNENGSLSTFRAIVHKERKDKMQTEYGFEEVILRDVGFPSNNTSGRQTVLMLAEIRIGGVKYQIRSYEQRLDFWHCTLKRVNVGEVSRGSRRGKM